ncbi:hypothetical protein C8R44DRAFT_733911 [Mycena epipterygia]|nr:hypothetical protein C8R44DRAFT_733911 [Mycena epipterygia]
MWIGALFAWILCKTNLLVSQSSEQLASAGGTVGEPDSDVTGARRVSSRKRSQADSSGATSNKRKRKMEDPLAGWEMQDTATGETLTGHEWVKCNPEEFAQRFKKDHKRYLDYLDYLSAKSGD